MATYSYDNFIKTPVEGDKKLEIYNAAGTLMYYLEPLDVNFFYRNNKVVVHFMRTQIERQPCRDHTYIELDFDTQATAQDAEIKANTAKNLILGFTEYYTTSEIDVIVETIESQIQGVTTGSTLIGLSDTPDSYTNYTGFTLTVDSSGTGVASADFSTASGYNVTASGVHSYARGEGSNATQSHSSASGYHATASGQWSFAHGFYATASGDYSTASGYYNVAASGHSVALGGHHNTVAHERSCIFGGSGYTSLSANTVYVPNLEITTNSVTSFVMTDVVDGLRYSVTLSGGTFVFNAT